MNVAFAKPMTLAEFLEWEEQQELRYEYDGRRPVAMTGGTASHAAIQRNLFFAVGARLRGKPCQFFGSHLKIEVAGRIRLPDGFVVCSRVPPDSKVVRDPVVIFEVLSESTAAIDLVAKNHEYAATTSVKRYVILSQNEIAGTVFERIGADWVGHLVAADSILRMPEIGVEFPLIELYERVEFSAPHSGDANISDP